MSNFGDHPAGFFGVSGFYNGVATQSLRFDDGSSAYLTRTPSSASNRKTWTWSGWIKLGVVTIDRTLFGAGTNNDNQTFINLSDTDQLVFNNEISNTRFIIASDAVFRDVSAWYHVVLAVDTTQSTNTNRVKIYVNGELQTLSSVLNGYPNQNVDTFVNADNEHEIGSSSWGPAYYNDGYMAEVNFVDGNAYDASYFGETKNGVWIPKKYTGSYGTNGFRLQFDQVGVGTASTSTIGADTSGNTHHFTSSGIVASDCAMPDSPENNFCTMNPLEFQENNSGAFLAEGNLKFSNVNANINSTFGFGNSGGKYYWEYLYVSSTDSNHYQGVTLPKDGISLTNAFNTGIALYFHDGTTRVDGTSGTGFGGQIGADNIIQFKLDLDNGTLQFGKNNTYIDALTLPTSVGGWRAGGIQAAGTGGTRVFVVNYGQDSSFAGTKTAQSNTDGNGNGNFFYAVPSGFLAVCSANLPEPTIGPDSSTQADDYFDTLLYTGNGSARDIGGLGFKPDWVWVKGRSYADHHALFDSSRGVTKTLYTNDVFAESTESDTLDEFRSDGFGINGTGADLMNKNSATYVAWNWKANGGTTTTNDASSTSVGTIDSVFQANTTAGFSIVTYTGTGSAGTIAHGLGAVPKWYFTKRRSNTGHWEVYHAANTSAPATEHLRLSTSDATGDDAQYFNDTDPTSTVFSVGDHVNVNASGQTYVAYAFAEVEGYSKFGSYTGNGNNDGPFIYTGFRPAWVLIKKSGSGTAAHWRLTDTARSPFNVTDAALSPSSNSAEFSENDMDILSNGFKLRQSNTYVSQNGVAFIYMAFAEAPFKYANAR